MPASPANLPWSRLLAFAATLSWLVSSALAAPGDPDDMTRKVDAGIDAPHWMPTVGPRNAPVTIVEISDFQCPFCARVTPTVRQILSDYKGQVRVIWANNPLPFHSRAVPAAIAALAAHRQGHFWTMHDRIFANARELDEANLAKWADDIGLNVEQWQLDRKDPALASQVKREQRIANALGATGTPSFLINGKHISGAHPFERFAKEIDAALKVATRHANAGKTGFGLILASWSETGGAIGTKAADYYLTGEEPAAAAPVVRPTPKAQPLDGHVWYVPVGKDDHIAGDSKRALVTIVEFMDLQCPFCVRASATLEQIRKRYGDKVRLVFKHTPLPFHSRAMPTHQAAIAAGEQGRFWPFCAKILANPRALAEADLEAVARQLGLNMHRFNRDRRSAATAERIARDMAFAKALGIHGTPSFLINGRSLRGAQPQLAFERMIDEELVKARAIGKRGEPLYEALMAGSRRRP